ncbi:15228_t:CDS:2, partial [Dentiscutata erythropus]
MNSDTYTKLLRRHAIPAICRLVPNGQGIFQQDNIPVHTCIKAKNQEVKRRLYNFPNNPSSIQDLEEKVKAA